jgi:Transcriptional regulator, AbiEi antitoxin
VIDRLIGALAAKQHGNITRQQLLELGLSSSGIAHRIEIGMLYPVFRGVYAVGSPARTPLQRAAAAVLACGPHAALAGGSAMTGWGFWRRWDQPFEVALIEGDRRIPGIRIHRPRNLEARDVRTQLGIRMTAPARTALDIAARRNDRQYKRDVNNALHSHYLTKGAIVDLVSRLPHHPATPRLKWFVTTEGGPTRSDWERMLPAFCKAQHLPPPVMGIPKAGHTPDASWPHLGIVLELDSWEYHDTRFDFETDHVRDLDYQASDLLPVRLTWELMIHLPDRTGAQLRQIVALRQQRHRRAA